MDVSISAEEAEKASTRERIIEAALEEFAAKGISGARVEQIAKRAGANVRMIYYYFGDKANLYREVNSYSARTDHVDVGSRATPTAVADMIQALFANAVGNPQFVRLLQWEALEFRGDEGNLANIAERSQLVEERIQVLREAQRNGDLPQTLDARMLYIAMHALSLAPFAFPTLANLATGESSESPEFLREYGGFLGELVSQLRQSGGS